MLCCIEKLFAAPIDYKLHLKWILETLSFKIGLKAETTRTWIRLPEKKRLYFTQREFYLSFSLYLPNFQDSIVSGGTLDANESCFLRKRKVFQKRSHFWKRSFQNFPKKVKVTYPSLRLKGHFWKRSLL